MSTKEFAAQLRGTLQSIKAGGTAAIYCDNLIAYLDEVIKSPSPVVTPAELARYEADLQLWIEQAKSAHESSLEMFRSVITAGQSAIRSAFLLNGGASVALLAFVSHLAETQPSKVMLFANSLLPFVIGVLAITMTSGFTYLSQWFYAGDTPSKVKAGFVLNLLAILLGLSSYGFFVWGMCRAYQGFASFV